MHTGTTTYRVTTTPRRFNKATPTTAVWCRPTIRTNTAPIHFLSPAFFFSSRRRHTRCGRDWSSDVCSSDLAASTCAPAGAATREPTTRCEPAARPSPPLSSPPSSRKGPRRWLPARPWPAWRGQRSAGSEPLPPTSTTPGVDSGEARAWRSPPALSPSPGRRGSSSSSRSSEWASPSSVGPARRHSSLLPATSAWRHWGGRRSGEVWSTIRGGWWPWPSDSAQRWRPSTWPTPSDHSPVPSLEDDRHRPVVHEIHFHESPEFARRDHETRLLEPADYHVDQGSSDFRRRRGGERRPSALPGVGIQGELADDEGRSADLADREVHRPLLVGKDPQAGDLVSQRHRIRLRVAEGHPDEDHQARADRTHGPAVDSYLGS